MAAAVGTKGQLGISVANPVTVRYDFQKESMILKEEWKDTNGVRGTRGRSGERVLQSIRRAGGTLELQPTSTELSTLLPWMLGGTPTGTGTVTYPLSDTLPAYYVTVDRVSKVFTYSGVKVDRWTMKASQGEPLEVSLDLLGIDETVGSSGTFPNLTLDVSTQPFMFQNLALTLNSTTVTAKDFTLSCNNFCDPERFFNSTTLQTVETYDRDIQLTCSLPYGDWSALYGTGPSGIGGTAIFTNGGAVLTMTFTLIKFPRITPMIEGRSEIMLSLTGPVLKSGSTLELVTTLAVGP